MTTTEAHIMHEALAEAVRPVLKDWGLEEQTDALIQVLAAFIREGYHPRRSGKMISVLKSFFGHGIRQKPSPCVDGFCLAWVVGKSKLQN